MALHINEHAMTGNLGDDARKHIFDDGNVEFSFKIANTKKFRRDSQSVKKTLWIRIKLRLPKAAEQLIAYFERTLKKGNSVYVKGDLDIEEWNQGDVKYRDPIIVATDVQIENDRTVTKPETVAAKDASTTKDTPATTPAAAPLPAGRQVLVPGQNAF